MVYNLSKGKANYSQRNNKIWPLASCNVTSMVMAMDYMGYALPKGRYEQPEDNFLEFITTDKEAQAYYKNYCQKNFKKIDTTIPPPQQLHYVLSYAANLWIGKNVTTFAENRKINDIFNEIRAGRPVVLSGSFLRPPKEPLGHIVCLVGYNDETREVIYDDPYGKTYDWDNGSGNDVVVSYDLFIRDIKPIKDKEKKMGHFFIA